MKIALMYCPKSKHPCGGAAECMRMFRERVGEFSIYSSEAYIASVSICDYCANETLTLSKTAEVLQKHGVSYMHVAACTSICPCGNYEKLKQFWQEKGMVIGEYTGCDTQESLE